jgi:ABC-type cobalamin/Fe3+-siderophores transport system ATPase subunit
LISKIRLKFGKAAGLAGDAIELSPITIFVGPNNSGKSRILAEINRFAQSGQKIGDNVMLDDVTFEGMSGSAADLAIDQLTGAPNHNEHLADNEIILSSRQGRMRVQREQLRSFIQNPSQNTSAFAQWFLKHITLKLDGPNRVGLVAAQPAGDLQTPSHSTLQLLFRDNERRAIVRRIVEEAFGTFFVIDPTNLGQLRIRLSARAPLNEIEEKGIHQDAVRFHSAAMSIDEASDGVKAFTGIITELYAGNPKILLVDEPEAFLHPALASKLGYEISRAAVESDKRVFVSTHSPTFVMGCIQSGVPVNIIRLTYRSGLATARLLPSKELLEMMRNPLLRSTNLLSGLFYEFVIVTESDADRAFYQEINERLIRFKPEWGIPNCLFINAQNKQTIHTILRPLRKLGIPAAGIVDVDVLKEGGTVWANQLDGIGVPQITRSALAATRSAIKVAMDGSGKEMKRDGGISILQGQNREACTNLFDQLAQYGLFVVEGGELESWLKSLQASGHGPPWLIDIFEKMGEDSEDADYIKPTDGDVWKFLFNVKGWLADPLRLGIPS